MAGPKQEKVPDELPQNVDQQTSAAEGLFDKLGKLKGQIIDEQTGELSAGLQKTLEIGFKEFVENLTSFDLSKAFSDLTKRITDFLGGNLASTDSNKSASNVAKQVEKVPKNVEAEKGAAVKPGEVFCFGDSLAVGPFVTGKYMGVPGSTKPGIGSGQLTKRLPLLKEAHDRGAKKIIISAGANDGVPNLENIKKIVTQAGKVFGPENVWLCDVPVYDKDPNYGKKFASVGQGIKTYNESLRTEFPDINIFHYETNGFLHPKSYTPIVAKIDKELNVKRGESGQTDKNVAI